MLLPRRKLPIGIQTFSDIRNEGYYYVDKTEIALSLTEQGRYYFLSRPRRSGTPTFLVKLLAERHQFTPELEDMIASETLHEGYYASVFYSYFAALGLDITLEDVTQQGQIDMTVQFNQQVYLFEFKVVELTPQGDAIQQLRDKGYAEKYRALNQPIHLIGVEFSRLERNIVGFDVETV